jgi:hypothetical protein
MDTDRGRDRRGNRWEDADVRRDRGEETEHVIQKGYREREVFTS